MCGIVAVLSRPDSRTLPDVAALAADVGRAADTVRAWGTAEDHGDDRLEGAASACEAAVKALRGVPGLRALLSDGERLRLPVARLGEALARFEPLLDQRASSLGTARVESLNAVLVRLKDAQFQIERDRLGNVERVRALAGAALSPDRVRAAYDINVALNALDRLEVRGRDSAGLHLYVRGRFGDALRGLEAELAERNAIPNFTHRAVRGIPLGPAGEVYSFVYKVAAEVGELGDNVRGIRAALAGDPVLDRLLETPGVVVEVLCHTRWASVGIISEANAHPLNAEPDEGGFPYTVGALNGDVDNYQALIREDNLRIAPEITTDAKVIPVLVSRAATNGTAVAEAFRRVVNRFDGSVAIAAASAHEPGRIYLALRGSGQALYVGLCENGFLVASEPYGVVEETSRYLRLDGEATADPGNPASRGQIVVLSAAGAGDESGIRRLSYDGTEIPLLPKDIRRIEITTRDVDRGSYRHFLKKEIAESPESIRKTLRGRLVQESGLWRASFGPECVPPFVVEKLRKGEFQKILVIGQGTAAVAGQAVREAIAEALRECPVAVDAMPATELSGFHMRDDMRDTLIVAISQSGTTTDTNRTVELVRSRGASVLGIVNRRHSDLTDRVHGVIYTSDGRDVEMSVASTKAFYSQVAAGILLGEALAQGCGVGDPLRRSRLLGALAALPDRMRVVLSREEAVGKAALQFAPPRRHWAIVGNGRNRIAAQEIRIKLSELCYKSIACDATEDKKHIDLSSEPLVLVCAAGLEGATAADVVKEVEIYRAHKACPIVIVTDGETRFRAAAATLFVPPVEPELAFILATMTGHLFGYHAAMSIDLLARPLREARGAIEVGELAPPSGDLRERLAPRLREPIRKFMEGLRSGRYNGALEAATAARLSILFRYATRALPLEYFAEDFGRVGTPGAAVEELTGSLMQAIEELSRPIDAIKHQAKTVTVGISRGDEAVLSVRLVREILATGVPRERLAYRELRTLEALDAGISEVLGYTRYSVEGITNGARIDVIAQGGIAKGMPSRASRNHELRGTKNTVATERQLLVAVGRSDGRPIVIIPEVQQDLCVGLVLLHVRFRDDLDAPTVRKVLSGYRNRYQLIRDAVAETNVEWTDGFLLRLPIIDLLAKPVVMVADELLAATRA
jgi:glucosamine--fructose-6-phosphate aminotransferase (isomerizing)